MSEPVKLAAQQTAAKPAPMCVRVVGKVLRVRRHEQHTYTTVITPAADEYSRPSVVEVRSKQRFAERDEQADFMGRLGGYEGRAYRVTDRDSGEQKQLVPVNMFLDLLGE